MSTWNSYDAVDEVCIVKFFLLFEADNADSFLDCWSKFKDVIRWYVEETHKIIARR
jgi:hypothetical protein